MDRPLVDEIVKAVRKCFRRKDITPGQMHHLAVLLFALERLPLATSGVNVTLTLSRRGENEMSYHAIDLDGDTFSLSLGGSVYDPNVGSDNFSDEVLMVETGGYRDAKSVQFVDWLAGFNSRVEDNGIAVDLDDGCEVDWTAEPDESAWERAAQEYGPEDESEDD